MKNIHLINKEITNQIKVKFGADASFWMSYLTLKKGYDYELNLNIFHYTFNLGDDGKTYLWNEYIICQCELSQFCETDFYNDELLFLKSIEQAKHDAINKYRSFTNKININKPIETNRLILKAFDKESSLVYDNYFYKNQDEFKKYYRLKYDEFI